MAVMVVGLSGRYTNYDYNKGPRKGPILLSVPLHSDLRLNYNAPKPRNLFYINGQTQ